MILEIIIGISCLYVIGRVVYWCLYPGYARNMHNLAKSKDAESKIGYVIRYIVRMIFWLIIMVIPVRKN